MAQHDRFFDDVQNKALERLLCVGSLRKLAREMGLPDNAIGALADLKHGRNDHISNATLREMARRLGVPVPMRPDTITLRLDPSKCGDLTTEQMRQAVYWEADHVRQH